MENMIGEELIAKLATLGVRDGSQATDEQLYCASVGVMLDRLKEKRGQFLQRVKASGAKTVCYFCMEFLLGRSFALHAEKLGVKEELERLFEEWGTSFDAVFSNEGEPGIGNGGLGRLAACYLDALSADGYAAQGFSLLYENGLFRQKIVDGEQVEVPDRWLERGGAWLIPSPDGAVGVSIGGRIEEHWNNGKLNVVMRDSEQIIARPYELLVPGDGAQTVNSILLWKAEPPCESVTGQLYPPDERDEGKLLRLTQQYLLVSASLQRILRSYFRSHNTLYGLEEQYAFHINDTHPALVIPELMRLLTDVYSYSWEDAWQITTRSVSYTNHTVMPEALECWREDLFRVQLPRIYAIVSEINRRFTADLWKIYPGDWERISAMSVLAYRQVRMANLAAIGSHDVNGVSVLHGKLIRESVFHDYYRMTPWKFSAITNGIDHRRWLCRSNPELCRLLDGRIGTDYRRDPLALERLREYAEDRDVLDGLNEVKRKKKCDFAAWLYATQGVRTDPESLFDVQAKRIHEYKRQLLNVLRIMTLAQRIKNAPNADYQPRTFIFGGKAAPGYDFAKRLIGLICAVSDEIRRDPLLRDRIPVVFVENYSVSTAQRLLPAADISEQISLAGKEASGTGCMKMMMNGAVLLGTADGANPEIAEAVGEKNRYLFGLSPEEVRNACCGSSPWEIYHRNPEIRAVLERFSFPIGGKDFSFVTDYLLHGNRGKPDPYLCLADMESYLVTDEKMSVELSDPTERSKKMLANIAASGRFSADYSVRRYARDIWGMKTVAEYETEGVRRA